MPEPAAAGSERTGHRSGAGTPTRHSRLIPPGLEWPEPPTPGAQRPVRRWWVLGVALLVVLAVVAGATLAVRAAVGGIGGGDLAGAVADGPRHNQTSPLTALLPGPSAGYQVVADPDSADETRSIDQVAAGFRDPRQARNLLVSSGFQRGAERSLAAADQSGAILFTLAQFADPAGALAAQRAFLAANDPGGDRSYPVSGGRAFSAAHPDTDGFLTQTAVGRRGDILVMVTVVDRSGIGRRLVALALASQLPRL